ncbi:hypothetical protein, partial [Mycobacteroides abscessus]|uniref:hypothetical protein n=1 Tax=Mycobacteroides abscessus TaxID=36809 RepID=UPI0019D15C01
MHRKIIRNTSSGEADTTNQSNLKTVDIQHKSTHHLVGALCAPVFAARQRRSRPRAASPSVEDG